MAKQKLTDTQRALIDMQMAGMSNASIAKVLNITEQTIKSKIRDLQEGFVKDRYDLPPDIRRWLAGGLFDASIMGDEIVDPEPMPTHEPAQPIWHVTAVLRFGQKADFGFHTGSIAYIAFNLVGQLPLHSGGLHFTEIKPTNWDRMPESKDTRDQVAITGINLQQAQDDVPESSIKCRVDLGRDRVILSRITAKEHELAEQRKKVLEKLSDEDRRILGF